MTNTQDLHVSEFTQLSSPNQLIAEQPPTETVLDVVVKARNALRGALSGKDKRIVVILGPCSIHDETAAYEYAARLVNLQNQISEKILLVMRVYFEKPRTTIGWKGLINDPHLNGSNDIEQGLRSARRILLKINHMGMPAATEFLDPIIPQYIADLVSWAAIGARTTESQTHRQMASGLSMPVGFKNATDGGLQVALDAMVSARHPHAFVGIDHEGRTAVVKTTGNPNAHLVLRGGGGKSNYSRADVAYTKVLLEKHPCSRPILIDCSHGNSSKNFLNQPRVFKEVLNQCIRGESVILGMMLESHLTEGRQDLGSSSLTYGQSITDGCIGWQTTEDLLIEASKHL